MSREDYSNLQKLLPIVKMGGGGGGGGYIFNSELNNASVMISLIYHHICC